MTGIYGPAARRASGSVAISSEGPHRSGVAAVDTLSEVVRSIRLRGNVYARWELTAPWGMALPGGEFATFHLVEEGECWLATADGRTELLTGGELVVLFDGVAHALSDRRGRATRPIEELVALQPPGASVCRDGGGGRPTRLVCGKFSAEGRRGSGFGALPPLVRLDGTRGAGRTVSLLAAELAAGRPGSAAVVERLSEVLVVQALQEVVDGLAATGRRGTEWLRALEDEHVWAALGLIHSDPAKAWTVGALARRVGQSRTVFAGRFRTLVGASPMAYVGEYRLLLAERWLGEGRLSVSEIAARIGYSSTAAFDRAYRKRTGSTPTAARRRPVRGREGPTRSASTRSP
jgi:AraC-like DNA-binding protein